MPMEGAVTRRPIPLRDRMQAMVRGELLRAHAENEEMETFEEADDFEDPDGEMDILSGHQVLLMDPEELGIVETLDGSESPKGSDDPDAKPTKDAADDGTAKGGESDGSLPGKASGDEGGHG